MPKHPAQEAMGQGDVPTGIMSGPDFADAVETYSPFVALAVSDITTHNLERTKHVVLISGNSIKFYKYDASSVAAEDGDTVIWDSEDRPFVLVQRGDRYDLPFSYTGAFAAGEDLNPIGIPTALTLPASLPGSVAFCLTVPTAEAVFTFEKSTDGGATWSSVFTVTFAIGARVGTFTLAAATSLAAGDMIRPVAPDPADATLVGFVCTVVCTR